eukprot:evm.model.scf_415.4 EVM.evm.TU.scf_415.4   scf_415:33009-35814(-)
MSSNGCKTQLPITFDVVYDSNLEQLKQLNNAIFPIRYQDKFYRDCTACGDVTQLAYHNGVAVGGIACRLERQEDGLCRLYIMTLGVLAPYRGMGVGSRLLERVLWTCSSDPNIVDAFLHVQVNNDDAIKFYENFGFVVKERVWGYYRRLEPPDAVILVKSLQENEMQHQHH